METFFYGNQRIGIKIDEKEFWGNTEQGVLRQIAIEFETTLPKYKALLKHVLKQNKISYEITDDVDKLEKRMRDANL